MYIQAVGGHRSALTRKSRLSYLFSFVSKNPKSIFCYVFMALGLALSGAAPSWAAPQQRAIAAAAVSSQRAVLNRYCVTCHNDKLKTADLMLDQADVDHVGGAAETWEKVVKKLRTGA